MELDLRPLRSHGHTVAGVYVQDITPTVEGDYTISFSGELMGTSFNTPMETFDPVLDRGEITEFPSTTDWQAKVQQQDDQLAFLQGELVKMDTQMQEVENERTWLFGGLGLGLLAVVLAVIAIILGARGASAAKQADQSPRQPPRRQQRARGPQGPGGPSRTQAGPPRQGTPPSRPPTGQGRPPNQQGRAPGPHSRGPGQR